MNTGLTKPAVAKPLIAKRPSTTVASRTTYRVSKAQSLRMAAHDKKIEAAEAKAAAAQKSNAEKKARAM